MGFKLNKYQARWLWPYSLAVLRSVFNLYQKMFYRNYKYRVSRFLEALFKNMYLFWSARWEPTIIKKGTCTVNILYGLKVHDHHHISNRREKTITNICVLKQKANKRKTCYPPLLTFKTGAGDWLKKKHGKKKWKAHSPVNDICQFSNPNPRLYSHDVKWKDIKNGTAARGVLHRFMSQTRLWFISHLLYENHFK